MYQWIGTKPPEPASNKIIRAACQMKYKQTECRITLPSFVDWAASLWTHKIRSAWSWKSDFPDGSPISDMK